MPIKKEPLPMHDVYLRVTKGKMSSKEFYKWVIDKFNRDVETTERLIETKQRLAKQ